MQPTIYWLEQTEASVSAENDWLSEAESRVLESLRFPKRRGDWRLGRWTAKRAVSRCLKLPNTPETLARIEVHPAPSGAPQVLISDEHAAVTISLSHCAGRAVCAVVLARVALGCDLESVEPRSDAFVSDYFAAEERAWMARTPSAAKPWLMTLVWSAKESALKALGVGLRLDTRAVVVSPFPEVGTVPGRTAPGTGPLAPGLSDHWKPLHVGCSDGRDFHGWFLCSGDLLRTVVASPPPAAPSALSLTDSDVGAALGPPN
jgi:4'-phosphopantetheinyl transferase